LSDGKPHFASPARLRGRVRDVLLAFDATGGVWAWGNPARLRALTLGVDVG
jgi:hypothetical protein